MRKRRILNIMISFLALVTFLLGVLIFDRVQTAQEQAYLATATVYTPPTTTAPPPTTVPVEAPSFSVTDAAGRVYTMEDFAGKPTVLCFWNGAYADARAELPMWETVQEKYGDAVHLVAVHVSSEKAGVTAAMDYLEEEKLFVTPYFDVSGNAAGAYGVSTYPTTFFINAQGQLKARARGNLSFASLYEGLERIGL